MKSDVRGRVWRLVDQFDLHDDDGPVVLRCLENLYIPIYKNLDGAGFVACVVPPVSGDMPTLRDPAYVVLDVREPLHEQRLSYAHEVGHIICRHLGSLAWHAAAPGNWLLHNRDEREAWEVAAWILIPWNLIVSGLTRTQIANQAEVPEWLVDMYPR